MNTKILVSIIIPTYNQHDLLLKCIESINNQSYNLYELIIINNGSTETNTNKISKNKNIKILQINFNKNYGFAKACNEGIKRAKGDLIALINNDVILDRNWLANLIKASNKYSKVSGFATKILKFNNPNIIESAGDKITRKGIIKHIGDGENSKLFFKEKEIYLIPAAACMFRKTFFKQVGLFDEKFGSYFEDVDISLRGQLLGEKYMYIPTALSMHLGKSTSKNMIRSGYYQIRNSIIIWIKNIPQQIIIKEKTWFYLLKNYLILIIQNFSIMKSINMLKALIYIFFNLIFILNQRKENMRNIKVKYRYIESIFSND